MSGLGALLALSLAAGFEVEADVVAGLGSRTSFGAMLAGTRAWPAWETEGSTGALRVGLLLGYQNEPLSLTAGALAPAQVTGSNHRTQLFVTLGPALELLASRRLLLGAQVFVGWTQLAVHGRLVDAALGIDRVHDAIGSEVTLGLCLHGGVQLSERLAIVARVFAPIPYAGLAVSPYVMFGLGLAWSAP